MGPPLKLPKPAVFLDRDGTLNVEKKYLHRIEDWEWIPGAVEAIREINQMGFLAIVVTNQAGVARGYYDENAVKELHNQVDELLAKEGAYITAYYYCPHHPECGEKLKCDCRKPKPGMLLSAQKDFNIVMESSFMIGDKAIDVYAAERAGVVPILVKTGYGSLERALFLGEGLVTDNILSAIKRIQSKNG